MTVQTFSGLLCQFTWRLLLDTFLWSDGQFFKMFQLFHGITIDQTQRSESFVLKPGNGKESMLKYRMNYLMDEIGYIWHLQRLYPRVKIT